MALATLVTLYVFNASLFGKLYLFILAVVFLCVLPLLAYPLQPVIPHFKGKGREGQRNLAMVFAVSGYVLGCITNLFLSAPRSLWLIYLIYLISGVLIVVINKALGLRASAHACGVAGPTALLMYFGVQLAIIPGVLLYFGALWASLKMRRHTWQQFIGGAVVPLAVLVVLHVAFFII
jgi:hypothetical protein